jgi:hypothetical protein
LEEYNNLKGKKNPWTGEDMPDLDKEYAEKTTGEKTKNVRHEKFIR